MRHGSLFSGIGGFDLAAESMGWTNVFHCEWMPFPRKILSHYWPEATSYHDITTTDFSVHRGQIDILTGGFPCQPYSAAGKRKGKDDDRHLWPHMLRCIREIEPRWVVGENVFGLATWNGGLVFEEVCAELEVEGYAVQPFVLPAAAVNAPHRRDRVWFVAYANDARADEHLRSQQSGATSNGEQRLAQFERGKNGGDGLATDAEGTRTWQNERRIWGLSDRFGEWLQGYAADATATRLQRRNWCEQTTGELARQGKPCNWQNFPTQSPICGGDDGLPAQLDGITFPKWRAESIKGYGNAIVPQVAMQIFRAIEAYERL